MNQGGISRIVAVLIGGAVMFGLELGLNVQLYIAIPAGILTYIVLRVVLDLMLKADTPAK